MSDIKISIYPSLTSSHGISTEQQWLQQTGRMSLRFPHPPKKMVCLKLQELFWVNNCQVGELWVTEALESRDLQRCLEEAKVMEEKTLFPRCLNAISLCCRASRTEECRVWHGKVVGVVTKHITLTRKTPRAPSSWKALLRLREEKKKLLTTPAGPKEPPEMRTARKCGDCKDGELPKNQAGLGEGGA